MFGGDDGFYKYHGCGNDFVLIDEVKNADYRSLAVRMCERRRGIGADGLIVCSPRPPSMRIFNSDGSEASMCGNGIRCAARYFADTGVVSSEKYQYARWTEQRLRSFAKGEMSQSTWERRTLALRAAFAKHTYRTAERCFFMRHLSAVHTQLFFAMTYIGNCFSARRRNSVVASFSAEINVDLVRIDGRDELTVRTFERARDILRLAARELALHTPLQESSAFATKM